MNVIIKSQLRSVTYFQKYATKNAYRFYYSPEYEKELAEKNIKQNMIDKDFIQLEKNLKDYIDLKFNELTKSLLNDKLKSNLNSKCGTTSKCGTILKSKC